jgi:NhaP-type Na+/H+ or K+/H+ antiporter
MAEAALTLLLFVDASGVKSRALRRDLGAIARLLLVGLLLTIVLGTVTALALFPGITFGLALLIASVLAPTDAALGQPVVTNPSVPARVRRLLNVESGLNDGIATPFVLLAIGLASAEATGHDGWVLDALSATLIGAAVGAGLGLIGGRLLTLAHQRGWTASGSRSLFVLALAGACYLVSISLGGNGFIAAFVGGLAFGAGAGSDHSRAVHFTEIQGTLLSIGVWTAFGLILAGELVAGLADPRPFLYALLSVSVLRMLPVAVALLGTRFQPVTVLFMGWFGPRGLASIVFLVIGLEGLAEAGVAPGPLSAAVSWTVLLSVILHGLSAGPLARLYGRRTRELPADAPELADAIEPSGSRLAWPRMARSEG